MTSREKFEEAISASPYEKSVARWPDLPVKYAWPGGYKDLNVDLAWWMWQASRKQTAEEAIDIVAFHGGSVDIEAHIRQLANPEGKRS